MNEIEKLQQLAGITPTIIEQPRSTTLLSEVDVNERDAGDSDNEKLAVGHVDNERDMIKRDLFEMGSYSVELFKMLEDLPDSDFPHWWQSKLVKAKTYISDCKHYLENSLEVPAGDDMTGDGTQGSVDVVDTDDLDPSGVS
tara:strand:- start:280 stop:702 length:423 start_codon:yes stop_codon:yes gene_type:complete